MGYHRSLGTSDKASADRFAKYLRSTGRPAKVVKEILHINNNGRKVMGYWVWEGTKRK